MHLLLYPILDLIKLLRRLVRRTMAHRRRSERAPPQIRQTVLIAHVLLDVHLLQAVEPLRLLLVGLHVEVLGRDILDVVVHVEVVVG